MLLLILECQEIKTNKQTLISRGISLESFSRANLALLRGQSESDLAKRRGREAFLEVKRKETI